MSKRYSDGAFAPAPLQPFVRATIAGTWGPVQIDGPESIDVDGYTYALPARSVVKLVRSTVGQIVHVKHDRIVSVLHRGKQLVESQQEAERRAQPNQWREIVS